MTSKLTRERLAEIAQFGFSSAITPANDFEIKELARLALDAMDSKPVFFIEVEGDDWINAGRIEGKNRPDLGLLPDGINYLYAAPRPLTDAEREELQERRNAERDSNPVGWTDEAELRDVEKDGCGYLFKANPITPHADPRRVIPLYRHAQPAPGYPEVLPCSVLLEPGLRFGKGIKTSTMLAALARRAVYESDMAALSPEERAEFHARIEDFKALIAHPVPVVPQDVLEALQKVARIRLDMNDFDGDRRGIADCLCDAEEALIEVVNHRADMLAAAPQPQNAPQNIPEIIPNELIAAVNRLLDSNGSRGCYSAIKCYDAHIEVERLLAASRQEVKP